jgi:IMP dehydrogenase
VICIDIAHGHHVMMRDALKKLRSHFPDELHIMAGNVATLQAFDELADWGANSIRVGIGGGSICSTRIVTGHGVPTLQSVLDCSISRHDVKIIADGGIKTTGDIVKAIAAGADFVMVGSMLAGTNETPGAVLETPSGEKYKEYRGMASKKAQHSWRGKSSTPEGVSTTVPYKGSVKHSLQDIDGGLRSGLSYSGARTIKEFQNKASLILQSGASQLESNTHILWRNK